MDVITKHARSKNMRGGYINSSVSLMYCLQTYIVSEKLKCQQNILNRYKERR
jgi:hypothetical protein